jgi:hypothetical protein
MVVGGDTMKSTLFLLALVAMVAGFGTTASAAEPVKKAGVKATTSELPAALKALNPDANKVLSVSEAQEIRGEHWGGWGWGGWWGGHWGRGGWGHGGNRGHGGWGHGGHGGHGGRGH